MNESIPDNCSLQPSVISNRYSGRNLSFEANNLYLRAIPSNELTAAFGFKQEIFPGTLPEKILKLFCIIYNITSMFVCRVSGTLLNNIMNSFNSMSIINICFYIFTAFFRRIIFYFVKCCYFFIFLSYHFSNMVV